MISFIDPIRYAWLELNRAPFPATLRPWILCYAPGRNPHYREMFKNFVIGSQEARKVF